MSPLHQIAFASSESVYPWRATTSPMSTAEVARASVWLFDDARQVMSCAVIVERGQERPCEGLSFVVRDFPIYAQALLEGECLVVNDARCDHRARELGAYLARFDVQAPDVGPLGGGGVDRLGHRRRAERQGERGDHGHEHEAREPRPLLPADPAHPVILALPTGDGA